MRPTIPSRALQETAIPAFAREHVIKSQIALLEAKLHIALGNEKTALALIVSAFNFTKHEVFDVVETCTVLYALNEKKLALQLIELAKQQYRPSSYRFDIPRLVTLIKKHHPQERKLIRFFEIHSLQ